MAWNWDDGLPIGNYTKLGFALLIDLFDFTIGRLLFFIPGLGELIGVAFTCLLWGHAGFFYALELLDPTEQIDGFIPMATIISMAKMRA